MQQAGQRQAECEYSFHESPQMEKAGRTRRPACS